MSWPGGPPFYYPASDPKEYDAAYAAWADSYARQPADTVYFAQPAYVPWQCYPVVPAVLPQPVMALPAVQPGYETRLPEVRSKKKSSKKSKKKPSTPDDSDDEPDWVHAPLPLAPPPPQPVVKGPGKKKIKDLNRVMHYVPSGQHPVIPEGIHPDGTYHHNWFGRTPHQIQADRHNQAVDAGVYRKREMVPDAKNGDKFWVVDQETGDSMLQSFSHIRAHLTGTWNIDDRFSSHFFQKTGEKPPHGWDPIS